MNEIKDHGTVMSRKPILCLDFDGVLHSYESGWKGAAVVSDPPVEGAVQFIMEAIKFFEVNIYSSRSADPSGIVAMRKALCRWIEEEGYPTLVAHAMTRITTSETSAIKFPVSKPSAMVTIDDRAITFDGTFPSINKLLEFQPWNKKKTSLARGA